LAYKSEKIGKKGAILSELWIKRKKKTKDVKKSDFLVFFCGGRV
jgi:hypothetical protein